MRSSSRGQSYPGLLGADELLVGEGGAEPVGVALAHHDDVLHRRALVAHLGQQRRHRGVDDDDLVLAVVNDVGQLLGEEPDVQRVEHRPHRGDGQIGLQVLLVVPGERPHPVRVAHPQAPQRGGQAFGPARHLGEGGAPVTGGLDGDDLAVAVDLLAVAEDAADEQRAVLHRAEHW